MPGGWGNTGREETIPDQNSRGFGSYIPELKTLNQDQINDLLKNALSYRERHIFSLRTGLSEPDGFRFTFPEIGHIFKISSSRARQLFLKGRSKFLAAIARGEEETKAVRADVKQAIQEAKALTPQLIEFLKNQPEQLEHLHWQVFEHLIGEFFASWGFIDVCLVGKNPNTAADIFAMQRISPLGTPVRIFIEVKRWKEKVGVEVVDRVYGAMLSEKTTFGWHMGVVVSMAGFKEMRKYDQSKLRLLGIDLRDGEDVKNWLKEYRSSSKGLWLPDPFKQV